MIGRKLGYKFVLINLWELVEVEIRPIVRPIVRNMSGT